MRGAAEGLFILVGAEILYRFVSLCVEIVQEQQASTLMEYSQRKMAPSASLCVVARARRGREYDVCNNSPHTGVLCTCGVVAE